MFIKLGEPHSMHVKAWLLNNLLTVHMNDAERGLIYCSIANKKLFKFKIVLFRFSINGIVVINTCKVSF